MTTAEKITFFQDLVHTVSPIRFTVLDEHFNFISDDSDREMYSLFFSIDNSPEKTESLTSMKMTPGTVNSVPVIYTNSVGMAWISNVGFTEEDKVRIFLLGPAFLDDYSAKSIERGVNRLQLSVKRKHMFMDIIHALPVVSLSRFYEYGIMLHFCLTGETVGVGDIVHADVGSVLDSIPEAEKEEKHGKYLAEQKLLKLVEEGNMNYSSAFGEYVLAGRDIVYSHQGILPQTKSEATVFTSLVLRAAIRGGVSPDTAYDIGEDCTAKIEAAENAATVKELEQQMLSDFVRRVHRIRTASDDISPQIRDACDYISLHIRENIDIHTLASRNGYTDYYFSTRFKKETGKTVRDYVMEKKVESAKEDLASTNDPVQDIAARYGFAGQSHFSSVFKKASGMTPGEYRKSRQSPGTQ